MAAAATFDVLGLQNRSRILGLVVVSAGKLDTVFTGSGFQNIQRLFNLLGLVLTDDAETQSGLALWERRDTWQEEH